MKAIIQPPLGTPINRSHPLAQGLVGCWLLNEGGGLRARDSTRLNKVDGALTASTFVNSAQGSCVTFNGSGGYVSMNTAADYPNLNLPGALTIIANINTTAASSAHSIFSDCNSGATSFQYVFEAFRTPTKLSFGQGTAIVATSTGATLAVNTWYRVGVVRSGGTGAWTVKFYVNGRLDTTVSAIATNPGVQAGTAIGRLGAFNGQYWIGLINRVMVYNRALTDTEMMQDYINPLDMFILKKKQLSNV